LQAETAKTELETGILRGDFIARQELERVFGEVANAIKTIVRSSRLSRIEQDDFLRALSSIKVVVKNTASRQSQPPAHGRNGANEPEPKKRKRLRRQSGKPLRVTKGLV
jgi:hypothetical protein